MLLILLLLEFLTFLFLFGEHPVLLLLVFLVEVGVSRVGRSRALKWRKIFGMNYRASHVAFATGRIATRLGGGL